jgi:hypothetical protein
VKSDAYALWQRLLRVFPICFSFPLAVLLSLSLSSLQRLQPLFLLDQIPQVPPLCPLRDFGEWVCVCMRVWLCAILPSAHLSDLS